MAQSNTSLQNCVEVDNDEQSIDSSRHFEAPTVHLIEFEPDAVNKFWFNRVMIFHVACEGGI